MIGTLANPLKTKITNLDSITNLDDKSLHELFKPGDILIYQFRNSQRPQRVGHCQMLREYDSNTKKFSLIDSYDSKNVGVVISNVSEEEIYNFAPFFYYEKIYIVKVNATDEQKNNAIDFAELQVGKKFDFRWKRINKNHNPEDSNDPNANEWYCSELPWAAYYNCNNSFPKEEPPGGYIYGEGIDIDYNGWTKDSPDIGDPKYSFVAPMDIAKDDDVQVFTIWEKEHPTWYYFIMMVINHFKNKLLN
jgi:uncharacterized protein YycO